MSVTVLSSEGLHFQYNGVEILTDISFEVQAGDYVGIVGPNGSGKTTLIKLALGFLKPAQGKIHLAENFLDDIFRLRATADIPGNQVK